MQVLPSQHLSFLLCTRLGVGVGEGLLRAETLPWRPAPASRGGSGAGWPPMSGEAVEAQPCLMVH